jgi:hypothetical protein
MTCEKITRSVNMEAVLARAATIKEKAAEPAKRAESARVALKSPTLGRLLRGLRSYHVQIPDPPKEGPALSAWMIAAEKALEIAALAAPKRPVMRDVAPATGGLGFTPEQLKDLGLK